MTYCNCLPMYEEGKCALFALGRNAMYAACKILGLKSGDEILTPAFDCDGALQPFKVLQFELQFFRSDPHTFAVDISDIKRRITKKTKLLHIINHFGMPQPWNELLTLKKETGIPIMEDNAYSLFSKFDNRHLGTFGDIAIFSLRKNLPLIDGGMLRINNAMYSFHFVSNNQKWFYSTEWSGVLAIIKRKLGYYKAPESLRRLVKKVNPEISVPPPLYSDKDGYPEWPLRDKIGREFSSDYLRPMSRLAKIQLSKFSQDDYKDVMTKKRQHYFWLVDKLSCIKGVKILWPKLPEGVIPFCLSFLLSSKRDIFFETLQKKYDIMAWPTLPTSVLEQLRDFPEVELLGKGLIQLNLPADKVRLPNFPRYLENLVKDIYNLAKGNIQD